VIKIENSVSNGLGLYPSLFTEMSSFMQFISSAEIHNRQFEHIFLEVAAFLLWLLISSPQLSQHAKAEYFL
jgi:hypothetical protein